MPVKSSNSSVLVWPNRNEVLEALRELAERELQKPGVRKIGYFGSLQRDDWGVGSDVDLVVVVEDSDEPFERRALDFDTSALPVAADVLVCTEREWSTVIERGDRFAREMAQVCWLEPRDE